MPGKTLFDKIWQAHLVTVESDEQPAILYIDRHLVHEVTSPQAFTVLRQRSLPVRRPERTFATLDHSIPTDRERMAYVDEQARAQVETLRSNCRDFGIQLFDLNSAEQGIIHVIAPELGLILPGQTVVCGDSHTSTHGAFGALAFGIGTSEVGYVLASQCLLQRKPKSLAINVTGSLQAGVTAKDLILDIIRKLGSGGGAGYVFEYRGPTIKALSMEERMTICNMSIEAGARAGLIAPDETTYAYLKGRPYAPASAEWTSALASWHQFASDPDAEFDAEIFIDAHSLEPMISYGTSPDQSIAMQGRIPEPGSHDHLAQALSYMQWQPGQSLEGVRVDVVFIGSCTNSRISDLRAAATILQGRRVAQGLRLMIVPGSEAVKRQAESEGLARIFIDAGAEWREPGCSLCIAMNGDQLKPGQLAVSTSNRNFAGRQGKGSRTLLASPLTAAATAIQGTLTDPRAYIY